MMGGDTLRVDTVITLLHVTNITQRRGRKLNCLKSESISGCSQQGANLCNANARPTDKHCLARGWRGWQGVCSGVRKEGTTKAILKACQGVGHGGDSIHVGHLPKRELQYLE